LRKRPLLVLDQDNNTNSTIYLTASSKWPRVINIKGKKENKNKTNCLYFSGKIYYTY